MCIRDRYIVGCLTYDIKGNCLICKLGYFLINNSCLICSLECKSCIYHEQICNECNNGKIITGKKNFY